MTTKTCYVCHNTILPLARAKVYTTCIQCGERQARATVRTVVPMHKSNYTLITRRSDLIGVNNKGPKQ